MSRNCISLFLGISVLLSACGEPGEKGEHGEKGEDGARGETGDDGLNALVQVTNEPAGDNCPNGGLAIAYGIDEDGDGVLDLNETTDVKYVCDGEDAVAGNAPMFGDLVFRNDSAMEAFCSYYNVLYGNLTIQGDDVSSLAGLSCLKEVYGDVVIYETGLTSLGGLSGLTMVDGSLAIGVWDGDYIGNDALTSTAGLSSLEEVTGDVIIIGNEALTTLDGFDALLSIDQNLYIQENPALTSVSGFSALESVTNELTVFGSPTLGSLGFSSLTSVEYLYIADTGLSSFAGFEALTTVTENLYAVDNSSLSDVSALSGIQTLGGFYFGGSASGMCDDATQGVQYLVNTNPSVWSNGACYE